FVLIHVRRKMALRGPRPSDHRHSGIDPRWRLRAGLRGRAALARWGQMVRTGRHVRLSAHPKMGTGSESSRGLSPFWDRRQDQGRLRDLRPRGGKLREKGIIKLSDAEQKIKGDGSRFRIILIAERAAES